MIFRYLLSICWFILCKTNYHDIFFKEILLLSLISLLSMKLINYIFNTGIRNQ